MQHVARRGTETSRKDKRGLRARKDLHVCRPENKTFREVGWHRKTKQT